MRPLVGASITLHARGYIKNTRTAVHVFVLARSQTSATPDRHRGRQQLHRRGPACRARRAVERDLRGHNRRALLRPAPAVRAAAPARLARAGRIRPRQLAGIEHIVVLTMENAPSITCSAICNQNQVMRP